MTKTIDVYQKIWTEQDFDKMTWHDNQLHGFAFEFIEEEYANNMMLDIDTILLWNPPENGYFSFWIAPATLIFEDSWDIEFNIHYKSSITLPLEIYEIELLEKKETQYGGFQYQWKIILTDGNITLFSKGFKQVIRKKPILSYQQALDRKDRGDITFSKTPYED